MKTIGVLRRVPWITFLPVAIVLAGVWAYRTSFKGTFLLDDYLIPIGRVFQGSTRPVTDFTFTVNYALGRTNPGGYHAVNLIIHLLCALTLFGAAHRVLKAKALRDRYAKAAQWLAGIAATLWVVHPLTTQAVTYVVQRAEECMGLFYLLTLYGVIRASEEPGRRAWKVLAVGASTLGMASKFVMVTAPGMALLVDRVFLSGSFKQLWKERGRMYVGLAATWGVLLLVLSCLWAQKDLTVGFGMKDITFWQYALTQPAVILHYLKLSFWPAGLIFDYQWPLATSVRDVWVPLMVVAAWGVLSVGMLLQGRRSGFVGVWVLVVLSPTSSVIPILDPAFEYRMYLPLAGLMVGLVVGGYECLQRWRASPEIRLWVAGAAVLFLVGILGNLTIQRNGDYRNRVAIWADTVKKRPGNSRAYLSLGKALYETDNTEAAISQFEKALQVKDDFPEVHNNLGIALRKLGRYEEAVWHLREAIRLKPEDAQVHYNLGLTLDQQGKLEEAIEAYRRSIRLKADYGEAYCNLGVVYAKQGRWEKAADEFEQALRTTPHSFTAHHNLAVVLEKLGKKEEAKKHSEAAKEENRQ